MKDIPLGLTFDDVLLQPGASDMLAEPGGYTRTRLTKSDFAQHSGAVFGDGYRDRGADGDCHGAAWAALACCTAT